MQPQMIFKFKFLLHLFVILEDQNIFFLKFSSTDWSFGWQWRLRKFQTKFSEKNGRNKIWVFWDFLGWGTNNENINIDDRKWLTSTTFSSPRNINIEKVRRRYSSFFFWAQPVVDVILCPIRKWKKKNGNNVECHYIWGL